MNCEFFQDQIVLHAAGELPEDAARELLAHTASCPECAGELKSYKTVLNSIPAAQKPPRDFQMLYGKALLVHDTNIRRRSFMSKIIAISAAAAVMLVCVTILFTLNHSDTRPVTAGPRSTGSAPLTTAPLPSTSSYQSVWNDKTDTAVELLKTGLDELSASFQQETPEDENMNDDKIAIMSDNIELARYNFENPEPSFSDSYYDYSVQEMKTNMDSLYYDLTEF
ncbi:MAG: zf-HC2 domain-containing protein [Planctomycetes bacterium]|nr:zf-HC2 domain-containing protein [Planctomycetota bacterium]